MAAVIFDAEDGADDTPEFAMDVDDNEAMVMGTSKDGSQEGEVAEQSE